MRNEGNLNLGQSMEVSPVEYNLGRSLTDIFDILNEVPRSPPIRAPKDMGNEGNLNLGQSMEEAPVEDNLGRSLTDIFDILNEDPRSPPIRAPKDMGNEGNLNLGQLMEEAPVEDNLGRSLTDIFDILNEDPRSPPVNEDVLFESTPEVHSPNLYQGQEGQVKKKVKEATAQWMPGTLEVIPLRVWDLADNQIVEYQGDDNSIP